ncbi:MAG: TIGR03032 family protein [Bacteroidetes bacterium]|uniref:TIGR03032 family protein n=1 Tax=Phnomibacter sp. TaxID=2836217 RepID=UPI002FDEC172|nr:TIGR03032 family protein [Bacteroidota bacterium]
MSSALPPFSCTYTPNVPSLLQSLQCSVAISTYQAGKVIFLSPDGNGSMRQLPRNFDKPMGMCYHNGRMALATQHEVVVLSNGAGLAKEYPQKPGYYDALFVPRASYYTGTVDLHDIAWDAQGRLLAVNTLFSCLVHITDEYSFTPAWTPPFISSLVSEDRCHLNGMCMVDGQPKYVTMFGKSDSQKGWRPNVTMGGLLMDVQTNEVILDQLPMPHTPRYFNGQLYCLLSATGELVQVDVANKTYEVISRSNGFVRGMDMIGEYLFVGLSKQRSTASAKRTLPVAQQPLECGIDIVHLPTRQIVGKIRYLNGTEELYDVAVLPQMQQPGILNHTTPQHQRALHLPDGCFWRGDDETTQATQ